MSEVAAALRHRIEHRTAYDYSAPVTLSHQQLHLSPRAVEHQDTLSHQIAIEPVPTRRHDAPDAFGNPLTGIAIESVHQSLSIVARSVVEVRARPLPDATPGWESIRDALAYRARWQPEPSILQATEFLFESPHVRVKRDLRAWASDCFEPERPIFDAVRALMSKIHAECSFDPKATTVTTPIMTFFEERRGVCQDFSHLMLSCLRSTGLAARYVSGYLVTRPPAGQARLVGADASHAWISVYVPRWGWLDFDPTNAVIPSTDHVTLTWGRDFSDVTPLRGVINGGGSQSLSVEVTVEPLHDDADSSILVTRR